MTLTDGKIIAEIAALLIAGAWAIYGFVILRQREKALAEVRKLELEAKKTEMELRRIAVIRTEISAMSAPSSHGGAYNLLIEVTLINEGKRDTRLKWEGEAPAIIVRPVEFENNGTPTFPDNAIELTVRQAKNPNKVATSHVIRAGGALRISFAAHLSEAGLYLISFRAMVAPKDVSVSIDAGTDPSSTMVWTATKYVII